MDTTFLSRNTRVKTCIAVHITIMCNFT